MLTGLYTLTGSLPVMVFLTGPFTTLKHRLRRTADPPVSSREPVSPVANTRVGSVPGYLTIFRPAPEHLLEILTFPSRGGMIFLAGLIAATLLSAGTVLFIDLPLPAMTGLGLFSGTAAVFSAVALRRRHSAGAWLGKMPGRPGDTGSSSGVPDITPMEEPAGPRKPACLPESSSLSTLEQYWVVEPFSFVKIERVGNEGFTYLVVEPVISQKEKTILMETYAHLRDTIIYDNTEKGHDDRISQVKVAGIIRQFDPDITEDRIAILYYYIRRDLTGYGPLEVLMRDPALEDLSCNGNDLPVFVFHRTYGSLPTSIFFTEAELNQFVLKLAQKANKQMSLSNPMVDATLPDGARIQITYSGVVSTKGSSFTIRKFRAEPMTPLDLIRFGTYDPRTLGFLWLAIEHRKSLLVVGGGLPAARPR